jgi:hypothetical protein
LLLIEHRQYSSIFVFLSSSLASRCNIVVSLIILKKVGLHVALTVLLLSKLKSLCGNSRSRFLTVFYVFIVVLWSGIEWVNEKNHQVIIAYLFYFWWARNDYCLTCHLRKKRCFKIFYLSISLDSYEWMKTNILWGCLFYSSSLMFTSFALFYEHWIKRIH